MWYYYLIVMIVSYFAQQALAPKPQKPTAATLSDFDIPQIEIGKPVGVVFGDCWIEDPNILWYGDLKNTPIYSGGGKK